MIHAQNNSEPLMGSQEVFDQMVKERLRQAVRVALIDILEEEVSTLIGARPYERSKERRDHRNGHYLRDLETTVGLVADLPVPRTRRGHQTQVFRALSSSSRRVGSGDGRDVCERPTGCATRCMFQRSGFKPCSLSPSHLWTGSPFPSSLPD
jgi:hypothetical protein